MAVLVYLVLFLALTGHSNISSGFGADSKPSLAISKKRVSLKERCDFSGTATVGKTAPTVASTSCVYPASPSQTVTTTTPTPTTTPTTPTTSTTTPLVFGSGISPTGSGSTGINDSSATLPLITRGTNLFFSLGLTLWSVLLWAW